MHSATSLPSVRQKTLGKLVFVVKGFAECRLLSVTLGKPFAECPRHSTKLLDPVVVYYITFTKLINILTATITLFVFTKPSIFNGLLYIFY